MSARVISKGERGKKTLSVSPINAMQISFTTINQGVSSLYGKKKPNGFLKAEKVPPFTISRNPERVRL